MENSQPQEQPEIVKMLMEEIEKLKKENQELLTALSYYKEKLQREI